MLLTVDDDLSVSRAVARDLRRRYGQDHQVLRASSGAEALDALTSGRAMYRVNRDGELCLCWHCTNRLGPALSARGWTMWPVSEHALAPQPT